MNCNGGRYIKLHNLKMYILLPLIVHTSGLSTSFLILIMGLKVCCVILGDPCTLCILNACPSQYSVTYMSYIHTWKTLQFTYTIILACRCIPTNLQIMYILCVCNVELSQINNQQRTYIYNNMIIVCMNQVRNESDKSLMPQ